MSSPTSASWTTPPEAPDPQGPAEVLAPPTEARFLEFPNDPERVRGPDVAFVSSSRLPEGGLPEGYLEGDPDLAVEVLSSSDNPVDIQQKVRDFLETGARLVWVIAPKARTVTVYRADGSARLLRDQEVLEGEEVLPGLTISLAEVFL
ncbi:MAG: Uma2 family endonuclease [Armatimonadota bacterium]